jgi:hypothetical protein
LTLDGFDAVDLAFDGTGRPRLDDGCTDGVDVAPDTFCQSVELGRFCRDQPRIELLHIVAVDDRRELSGQDACLNDLRRVFLQAAQE